MGVFWAQLQLRGDPRVGLEYIGGFVSYLAWERLRIPQEEDLFGEGRLGYLDLPAASVTHMDLDKQQKMDGCMDGWNEGTNWLGTRAV